MMAGWKRGARSVLGVGVLLIWVTGTPPVRAGAVRDEARAQWVREFAGKETGVAPESVTAIAIDADGSLWLLAGGKLVHGSGGKWSAAQTLPNVSTVVSIPLPKPHVLAGGADGVGTPGAAVEAGSPKNVDALGTAAGGDVLAIVNTGDSRGVWARNAGWKMLFPLDPAVGRVRQIARPGSGATLVLTGKGLFRAVAGAEWKPIKAAPGGMLSDDVAGLENLGTDHALLLTARGLSVTDGAKGWLNFSGKEGLPIEALKCASVFGDAVWFGTEQGVVLWRGGRFAYFAGPRWLPDDRVCAIAAGKDEVWVATRGGISHIFQKPMTLAEKADFFERLIDARPRRLGFVTVVHSDVPGDFTKSEQEISDNDGLWTSMYVAAECFRYAATQSDDARKRARRSMQALLRLESITGISGFPARSISNIHDPAHARRSGGQWHASPVEKDWMWKGDTSSDEIVGHYLAFYLYSKLVADGAEKRQIRDTCKRITDHITEHGYNLVDITGKPTTWGKWSPEELNDVPNGDRGLNSLEILSHLRVAMALVGDERYKAAYLDLIDRHHYALNTVRQRWGNASEANHSDDELAFLSYYPLLKLETEPALKSIYQASLRRTWDAVGPEACPAWNFIFGACSGNACDVEASVDALYEIPLDLTHWPTANARRADLKLDPVADRFAHKQLLRPLPWTERQLHKWNDNPYELDGGSPREEEDPTFWLLPYWMGRYHHLID